MPSSSTQALSDLAYLGVKAITSRSAIAKGEAAHDCRPITIYYQGFLTNLLNPKVAVFFLSFLPQFVSTSNHYGPVPFVILGLTFLTTGTLWCLLVAVFASQLTGVLRRSTTIGSVLNKAVGILFLGMGGEAPFGKTPLGRGIPFPAICMIITIDGPAGAGKSSVARALARRLGFRFLDTGGHVSGRGPGRPCGAGRLGRAGRLARLARKLDLRVVGERILLDGEDVTEPCGPRK